METVVRLLTEAAPKAIPRLIDVPHVVGAALLGLDHTGAAPTAHHTLRSTFAPSPGA